MKKIFIFIIIILGLFMVYYFGKDYLSFGNKLEKLGYSEKSSKKIKELGLEYYINNVYYETIDHALEEEKYINDYLNDYMKINYVNNDNFIDYTNSMLKNEYSSDDVNNYSDLLKNKLFKMDNLERYISYKKDNKDLSFDETITYTNIGIDNPFYTDIQKAKINDGILILVNKYYSIDSSYDGNLVTMDTKYGGGQFNKEAYEHFKNLCDDAKKDGISLKSISAYRSYSTQESIYNRYVREDGVKNADTYSARPGHSEHQTGLGVDINTASSSYHFENTKEYDYLIKNSYKYGFILRYPKGKEFITGYKYEPWHYRYVGIDAAKVIHDEDITFEEYAVKYLNY